MRAFMNFLGLLLIIGIVGGAVYLYFQYQNDPEVKKAFENTKERVLSKPEVEQKPESTTSPTPDESVEIAELKTQLEAIRSELAAAGRHDRETGDSLRKLQGELETLRKAVDAKDAEVAKLKVQVKALTKLLQEAGAEAEKVSQQQEPSAPRLAQDELPPCETAQSLYFENCAR